MTGYRKLIDDFVDLARTDVEARRIEDHGHPAPAQPPLTSEDQARRDIFLRLGPEARALVARMLTEARQRAVHDVCACLEDAMEIDGLRLRCRGEDLRPVETMHFDFICRLMGDEWPEGGPENGH